MRLRVILSLLAIVPVHVQAQGVPLTVDRAVAVALERNRDVRGAQLELESARKRVREAWGSVYPSLDLNATYTRNLTVPGTFLPRIFFDPNAGPDELIAVKFGSDNMWNLNLRMEQPLFQATAFIGVGAAGRYEALQREVVRGRTQMVVTRVRVAYYNVLLADESVRLTENTLKRIRQTLDETKKMEHAGVSSNYDVLRLEVELANVEPALRRARNAARSARRALAVELGLPEMDSVPVAGALTTVNVDEIAAQLALDTTAQGWEQAVQLAQRSRSELRQLDLTKELRRAEKRAEQSEYLPKLSLFGSYSINAQQSGTPRFFGENEAQRAYGRQVGVQFTMPIFSGFERPARVAQRDLAITAVETQRELAADQVASQVRTSLEQVQEAWQRARAQRFAVQQAQRGYQIASAQYREGISSALEVTDAETALRQSEFNLAEAVYDFLVAQARLDEAMGTVDIESHASAGLDAEVER